MLLLVLLQHSFGHQTRFGKAGQEMTLMQCDSTCSTLGPNHLTRGAPEVEDGKLVAVVGADGERRHVAHLHRQHRLELLSRVHLQYPGEKKEIYNY